MHYMRRKTEMYSWRIAPATRELLTEAARARGQSVARVLDEIVTAGLHQTTASEDIELERQQQLHARAARFAGALSGGRSERSSQVRQLMRERLRKRRDSVR